jgi:hypothetical protein
VLKLVVVDLEKSANPSITINGINESLTSATLPTFTFSARIAGDVKQEMKPSSIAAIET